MCDAGELNICIPMNVNASSSVSTTCWSIQAPILCKYIGQLMVKRMVHGLSLLTLAAAKKNGVYSLTIIIIIIIGFAQMHSLVALLHSVSCSGNLNENAFFSSLI